MMNEILKNKWVLSILLIFMLVLAVWFFMGDDPDEKGTELQVNEQAAAEEAPSSTTENDAGIGTTESNETYYFVKESDGEVNVYRCSGNEKEFLQKTSITFALLSDEDQKLLETGIKLKDEQELTNFLENFDS